ncbi:MAG: MBL fold metallo-hydrolase [Candidatus Thorarchaeota archaeon]|nr:MBL fold metallo-hydrolase [Candidatus Thorarchaeota archaeon]
MTVTIRLMAHASVQIKTDTQNIYIDPSTKGTGLKKDHFQPADLILVTHGHQDHFDKDLLKKIRKPGNPVIAPESLKKEMKGIIMWDLNAGQMMKMGDGTTTIWSVPAYNVKRFKSPGNPYHPKDLGVGYILKVGEKKIYHAGDTDFLPEMDRLEEADIDVALLPIGDTYTMDIADATEAASVIKAKIVIPIHVKDSNPDTFKTEVESKTSSKVVILKAGEEYKIE